MNETKKGRAHTEEPEGPVGKAEGSKKGTQRTTKKGQVQSE